MHGAKRSTRLCGNTRGIFEIPSEHLSVAFATLKCSLASQAGDETTATDEGPGIFARCSSPHLGYQKRNAFRRPASHDRAA
jgi:hypothetical protein